MSPIDLLTVSKTEDEDLLERSLDNGMVRFPYGMNGTFFPHPEVELQVPRDLQPDDGTYYVNGIYVVGDKVMDSVGVEATALVSPVGTNMLQRLGRRALDLPAMKQIVVTIAPPDIVDLYR